MMCLLLELDGSQPSSVHTIPGYEPIEEHHGARVIQLVHLRPWVAWVSKSTGRVKEDNKRETRLVEVRYLRDVAEVNDGKILHFLGDGVEGLVHHHALGVPVVPKAYNDDAVLFGFYRLIDVPARRKVWQKVRHNEYECSWGF
jgi:hypothetical protein